MLDYICEMEKSLQELLIPSYILAHFEFEKVEELGGVYRLHLLEKHDVNHIPKGLIHKGKAVLNGFTNPIELQTYPIKGQEAFLYLTRRRWKLIGTSESSQNTYDFTQTGMKATKEFGAFLKEIGRG